MDLLKRPIRKDKTTQGAMPATPMPGGEQRQLKRGRLALGLIVVAFSAFLGWLIINARGDTTQVWVASQDIAAGTDLTTAMLVPQEVPSGSQLSSLTPEDNVLGRTTRLAVPAGSTLVDSHLLRPGDTFETDDVALVGLALGSGEVPAEIGVGDVVRLIPLIASSRGTSIEATLDLFEEVDGDDVSNDGVIRIVEATVRSVAGGTEAATSSRGSRILTVEVPSEHADRVALLAARGQLVVTIIGRS